MIQLELPFVNIPKDNVTKQKCTLGCTGECNNGSKHTFTIEEISEPLPRMSQVEKELAESIFKGIQRTAQEAGTVKERYTV